MFRYNWIIVVFLLFISESKLCAEYEISGKLNISSEWQYQIFLATINKLDDYYNANPENIIQVGNIEQDGSFTLKGDNLPPESRFYRLYLIKEENSEFDACLYVGGEDHNFIHIIMDNSTKVHVNADPSHFAPFGNYDLHGDAANLALKDLNMLITPSFYFYEIRFPSELQFSQQKLNRDLFHFADTCDQILVSLAAMVNTDMDQYFELEYQKYLDFGKELSEKLTNHSYTEDYFRKMNYYSGDTSGFNIPKWIYLLIAVLILALLLAVIKIFSLLRSIRKLTHTQMKKVETIRPTFTKQEEKILALILQEKSNKEIASELFIELSTVKTHINKLYSKLGVKNRNEAKTMAKTLKSMGV